MDMLSLVYTISAVVGGGFLVWLNTKSGRKMARKSIVYFSLEIEGIMDALGFSLATKVVGWSVLSDALQFWLMYEKEIP